MNNRIIFLVLFVSLSGLQCGGGERSRESTAFAQAVDTLDQGLVDPVIRDIAIVDTSGNVAVDAGFAADGTVVSFPVGFGNAQCKVTAAPALIDGSAISIQASINETTGEVICEKVVQERVDVPAETKGCVASYTILCVK